MPQTPNIATWLKKRTLGELTKVVFTAGPIVVGGWWFIESRVKAELVNFVGPEIQAQVIAIVDERFITKKEFRKLDKKIDASAARQRRIDNNLGVIYNYIRRQTPNTPVNRSPATRRFETPR